MMQKTPWGAFGVVRDVPSRLLLCISGSRLAVPDPDLPPGPPVLRAPPKQGKGSRYRRVTA